MTCSSDLEGYIEKQESNDNTLQDAQETGHEFQQELGALRINCEDLSTRLAAAQLREAELAADLAASNEQFDLLNERLELSKHQHLRMAQTLQQCRLEHSTLNELYSTDKEAWQRESDHLNEERLAACDRLRHIEVPMPLLSSSCTNLCKDAEARQHSPC